MHTSRLVFTLTVLMILLLASTVFAQQSVQSQVDALEKHLWDLENHFFLVQGPYAFQSALGFLFGSFCALWAQNSGRNPWLWFFLGMLFNIITVLVLLSKNSSDREARTSAAQTTASP